MKPAPIDPPEIHRQLWDNVGRGYLAWDIGANCGQTLGELTSRFTRVMAFEPAEECWSYFTAWTGRVELFPFAISDLDGDIQLAALPDKIDTGQLVTPGTHGMEWSPDVPEAVARTIPARSIDGLLDDGFDRPDFIKLDVEGHEGRVLAGAKWTLHMYRPQWLIEFHTPELHEDCRRVLTEHGYRLETVRHPHYATGSDMWHNHGWLKAVFPS